MSVIHELPCIVYGVDPNDKTHVATQMANIAKCNDISFAEMSAYSDILAHGYGLWDKTGMDESILEDCYKKRHRKNYCTNMLKECSSLKTCTELYTEKMQHAYCLVCELGNENNAQRRKKEFVVLYGLLNRCISTVDIKEWGGAEKIFISWSCVCGHARVGNSPIVRFTYHMYNVLEYYLLLNTESLDIKQIAMEFNSSFIDSYACMAAMLDMEVDDIAEIFFNYIFTHFSNYKEPLRNEVVSLLEELGKTKNTGRSKKKNVVSPPVHDTVAFSILPDELALSVSESLGISMPVNAVSDVSEGDEWNNKADATGSDESEETLEEDNVDNVSSAVETALSEKASLSDDLPVDSIGDVCMNPEPPKSDAFIDASEPSIVDKDEETLLPLSSNNNILSNNDTAQNPVYEESPADNAYCKEKKFRTLRANSNIYILNEFNCQRLTLHSLIDFISVEIAMYNGITGILIYLSGTDTYYFAAFTSVITGVIRHLFRSNVTVLTTNLSLLLNYLSRYDIDIVCNKALLDLYLSLFLTDKNDEKYMITCQNILSFSRDNGIILCEDMEYTLIDSMKYYEEIYHYLHSSMSKNVMKKYHMWSSFEEFMGRTYSENTVNYPYPLYERESNTQYLFCPQAEDISYQGNILTVLDIESNDSLYGFFCYCCSHIRMARVDSAYNLRVCNITDEQLVISYRTDRKNDMLDSLWQLVSADYAKLFHTDCTSLTIVFPER